MKASGWVPAINRWVGSGVGSAKFGVFLQVKVGGERMDWWYGTRGLKFVIDMKWDEVWSDRVVGCVDSNQQIDIKYNYVG